MQYSRRAVQRILTTWLLTLPACDCGGKVEIDRGDAGADGGGDAGPEPEPTRVACGDATLVVHHRPLQISLERGGVEVLGVPAGDVPSFGFATIVAPQPEEFFDPSGDDRVTWSAAGDVLSVAEGGAYTFEVETDVAEQMLLDVRCEEDGHLRLAARLDAPADVVLSRALFATDDADRYHGLGEQFSGPDSRGFVRQMELHVGGGMESGYNEVHVPVPFVVSPRGWGAFVESRRAGSFDIGASDSSVWSATFDEVGLVLHLFAGAPLDVVAAYTRTTGLPELPPEWAHGAFYWRNENVSSEEVLADAAEFRARDIPTSVLWIDNPWQVSYNDFTFEETRFGDPQGLLDALVARGFLPMLWSTPYLDAVSDGEAAVTPAEELFLEAEEAGYLVTLENGATHRAPWTGPSGGVPDFTNPDAVDWFAQLVGRATGMGIVGFKLDFAEDILVELIGIRPQLQFSSGETEATVHGVYSQLYHRTYQEQLERDHGEGFILGRASVWGGQADVDCIWPGDLDADFSRHEDGNVGGLPAAVAALQSLAASGFPMFGSDTGGYRDWEPDKELLLRWAAANAFSPLLQLGGGGGAGDTHAPWVIDEETVDAYRTFARWHVDLAPTMRAWMERAATDGTPLVRAMALAFPDDPDALDETDQYMLGPDILVAPLVEGGDSRSVYLPEGRWLDLFSDEVHFGPATIPRDTPLDEVPAFLRAGGILVLGSPEIDTLVPTDDVDVVDSQDRASFRRVIAFGDENGASATAQPRITMSVGKLSSFWVQSADPGDVTEIFFQIHRPRGDSVSGLVGVASATEVIAGCDCFFFDAARQVLLVGTAGETEFEIPSL